MPDRRRYFDEPAPERLATRVVESGVAEGRPWVRLEETIFFPEGGGQPADHGTIGDAEVVDVQSRGAEVVHLLDRQAPRGEVQTALDTTRRFDHCQQHTAQHLLTAVLLDRHGMPTTSFHLGADYTAIEVRGTVPGRAALRGYEREVNALLREDRAVRTRWVDPEALAGLPVRSRGLPEGHVGPVRLVEIEGLDLNTCGGTHVARLGEIQTIEVLDAEGARGGARIRFLAGGRVFASLDRRRDVEQALRSRLGTAPTEFDAVLASWEEERKHLARRVRELEAERAEAAAVTIASEPAGPLCALDPRASLEALRALAQAVLRHRPDAVVVVAGGSEDPDGPYFLVQAGPDGPDDVGAVGARVRDAMGAKGGGRGRTFQGKGGSLPSPEQLRRAAGEA